MSRLLLELHDILNGVEASRYLQRTAAVAHRDRALLVGALAAESVLGIALSSPFTCASINFTAVGVTVDVVHLLSEGWHC